MSPSQANEGFTRGEKCIFAHLVVTFLLILTLVVVYFCHLCLVRHGAGDVFRVTRRKAAADSKVEEVRQVGVVFLSGRGVEKARVVCGCVAVRPRWSAAPAHCVAARSDPALAPHLPSWRVGYLADSGSIQESGIVRSVVHSHYIRDDSQNNIGLFEHKHLTSPGTYQFTNVAVDDDFLYDNSERLAVAELRLNPSVDAGTHVRRAVEPVSRVTCRHHVAPVMELREYEACAYLAHDSAAAPPDLGAALVAGSEVLGFFSWGDRRGALPLVVLNLAHFTEWMESVIN